MRISIAIFLIAFFCRAGLVLVRKTYHDPESSEPIKVAGTLLQTGRLADAYGKGSGPTAHVTPIYPGLVAGIMAVTGEHWPLAVEIQACLWSSMLYALLPALSAALKLGLWPGALAGLVGAVLPFNFWAETKGSFEQPLMGLALEAFLIALVSAAAGGVRALYSAAILAGFGALLSPALLLPIAATAIFVCYSLYREGQRHLAGRLGAGVGLGLILFLTPWAIRNSMALGSPVFTRSNFGLEFALSNNSYATADYQLNRDAGLFDRFHPLGNRDHWRYVATRGEVEYNSWRRREALNWIASNPGRFATLTAQRAVLFWFPPMRRWHQQLISIALGIAGGIGCLLLLRQKRFAGGLAVIAMTTFAATYSLIQVFARYSYPIQFLLWLCAGWLGVKCYELYRARIQVSGSGANEGAGTGGS